MRIICEVLAKAEKKMKKKLGALRKYAEMPNRAGRKRTGWRRAEEGVHGENVNQ